MILGAAQSLHALAIPGPGFVNEFGHGSGTDKTDGLDIGMHEQAFDGDAVTLQHIEDAIGNARPVDQFRQKQTGRGIFLGRLQDEGIPAGDGIADHPHGNHGGEIEGRDADHHAQRLADLVDVYAAAGLFGITAF